jgi:hypothetical protein
MYCSKCGGNMLGDGYREVIHCEQSEWKDYRYLEPDAEPILCDYEENVLYKEDKIKMTTIYKKIQKDKLQVNANRALLSLIMSEICKDGKPMENEDAIKKLVVMKKNATKTIELLLKNISSTDKKINEETIYLALIENYLPDACQCKDVEEALLFLNLPKDIKSMGIIMKHLKTKFDVIDGNIVKSVLLN